MRNECSVQLPIAEQVSTTCLQRKLTRCKLKSMVAKFTIPTEKDKQVKVTHMHTPYTNTIMPALLHTTYSFPLCLSHCTKLGTDDSKGDTQCMPHTS